MMIPFHTYPQGGQSPLGKPKNSANCRYGYGLELQRLTGQTNCAYCGVSLVDDYYHWLLMSVDHVVPRGEALRLGIPAQYSEDFINLVLCCAGCNGFGNRYRLPHEARPYWQLHEFVAIRDEAFAARFKSITIRREAEQRVYLSKPWEQ
jgi:hypothetical protein